MKVKPLVIKRLSVTSLGDSGLFHLGMEEDILWDAVGAEALMSSSAQGDHFSRGNKKLHAHSLCVIFVVILFFIYHGK